MPISKLKREKIYRRDGYECVKCGSDEYLTIDHFIPQAQGGDDGVGNLQTLCYPCNQTKGDSVPTKEEEVAHQERIAEATKKKKVNWSKIKIPPVGMSDGLVQYLLENKITLKKKGVKTNYSTKKLARYVKYVKENAYVDFWIKGLEVGKIYRPEDFPSQQAYWERALFSIAKDCFEEATKLQWNCTREHSVGVKYKYEWSSESYNESINRRVAELKAEKQFASA